MKDLQELHNKITERLNEIRSQKTKSSNDRYEYEQLQKKAREISNVMIYIKRMKEEK